MKGERLCVWGVVNEKSENENIISLVYLPLGRVEVQLERTSLLLVSLNASWGGLPLIILFLPSAVTKSG